MNDPVILLKEGRVLAEGPAGQVMSPENLGRVHDTPTRGLEISDNPWMYVSEVSNGTL